MTRATTAGRWLWRHHVVRLLAVAVTLLVPARLLGAGPELPRPKEERTPEEGMAKEGTLRDPSIIPYPTGHNPFEESIESPRDRKMRLASEERARERYSRLLENPTGSRLGHANYDFEKASGSRPFKNSDEADMYVLTELSKHEGASEVVVNLMKDRSLQRLRWAPRFIRAYAARLANSGWDFPGSDVLTPAMASLFKRTYGRSMEDSQASQARVQAFHARALQQASKVSVFARSVADERQMKSLLNRWDLSLTLRDRRPTTSLADADRDAIAILLIQALQHQEQGVGYLWDPSDVIAQLAKENKGLHDRVMAKAAELYSVERKKRECVGDPGSCEQEGPEPDTKEPTCNNDITLCLSHIEPLAAIGGCRCFSCATVTGNKIMICTSDKKNIATLDAKSDKKPRSPWEVSGRVRAPTS